MTHFIIIIDHGLDMTLAVAEALSPNKLINRVLIWSNAPTQKQYQQQRQQRLLRIYYYHHKGATVTNIRGGLQFLHSHFYLFHKGNGKLYFFRIDCISTMSCGHSFISRIFHENIYFPKSPAPPLVF